MHTIVNDWFARKLLSPSGSTVKVAFFVAQRRKCFKLDRKGNSVSVRTCISLTMCALLISTAHAASVVEQLASFGYPNIKICGLPKTTDGLRKLLVIQFPQRKTSKEEQKEAVAILKLLTNALIASSQNYIGIKAIKNWDTCGNSDPEYTYWRDYDDNWRYMSKAPVRYLSQFNAELPPEIRGTADEAFVLFSLGLVEQRLDRIPASVKHFEKAYDILQQTDDPHKISAYVLVPLIHYHFGKDGDERTGQDYLNAFALITANSPTYQGDYLPLIKVAPVYPSRVQRSGREGHVIIEFLVDAQGKVQNPVVLEEFPPGVFGAAAVEAAKSFRYVPRVVNGVLVPTAGVRNRITFELN